MPQMQADRVIFRVIQCRAEHSARPKVRESASLKTDNRCARLQLRVTGIAIVVVFGCRPIRAEPTDEFSSGGMVIGTTALGTQSDTLRRTGNAL
jgi:hypothetical protein